MMNEVVDLKNYSDLKLDQNPLWEYGSPLALMSFRAATQTCNLNARLFVCLIPRVHRSV